eukprot:gnl/TRDRNA2_/TRDRNA2_81632_c0_seq1.p1 gnl/TRDRNA2_/TRDRNA2_81632_c0~~gnl/TRDRNA2_/TRDRNA2_81632_c0_seq1.p1  ORF type:complete len:245 (-),score=31.22 gnl/TRDRNA2_/TRDRNA2_81632_c0_seq1:105-800(-)
MTEAQVCNHFRQLLLSKGIDDASRVVCKITSHSQQTMTGHPAHLKMQPGDTITIKAAGHTNGYFCSFTRIFNFGPPSQEIKSAYAKLHLALAEGLQLVKPGAKFQDIYNAIVSPVSQNDSAGHDPSLRGGARAMPQSEIGSGSHVGHSMGLQPFEWPAITRGETTELREGMVFSLGPSIGVGNSRTMLMEEAVLVTSTGYRMLSGHMPAEIPLLVPTLIDCDANGSFVRMV